MGNGAPKPGDWIISKSFFFNLFFSVYHTTHREITECYLNSNPEFLTEYTFRNEHLLDQFVHDKVTKERICGWSQQKKQQKPDKPVTPGKSSYFILSIINNLKRFLQFKLDF